MHQRATRLLQRYARRCAIPCARCCWVHVGIEGALHTADSGTVLAGGRSIPIYIQSCMVSSAFAPTRVLASWLSKRALCKALPQLFKPARPTRVDGRGGSQRGFCAVLGADPCRAHSKCIPAPLGPVPTRNFKLADFGARLPASPSVALCATLGGVRDGI